MKGESVRIFWCPDTVNKDKQREAAIRAAKEGVSVEHHSHASDQECYGVNPEGPIEGCWRVDNGPGT